LEASSLKSRGHSADVQIQLYVNGHVLPVAQLGGDFLVLRAPIDCPPSEAVISMSIDGNESRWRIRLAEGISSSQTKTSIARCE
jgi:hypothetical protein